MKQGVRRTTLQLVAFVAALMGLGFSYFGYRPNLVWLLILAMLIILTKRRNLIKLLLVIILASGIGLWRGNDVREDLSVYNTIYDQKIIIEGVARDDANYNKYKQFSFDVGSLRVANGEKLPGKILVSGFGSNSILQGDIVQIEGKLRPAYGTYVGKISYAQISVIESKPNWVGSVKRDFASGMRNALPEPVASFSMGLLIGQRIDLPEDVKRDLLVVGLTHIIAVSGYNLTIILQSSKRLLAKRSKKISLLLSAGLIIVFLLITGASASIVRASIVSMLSIWALYFGRQIKPLNLIVMAATITAWANPLYVWADMSWYLSFLAFYGVLVIAPLVASRLKNKLRNSLIFMVGLESVCAEIMTLPYVLQNFEQISIIGLPANILVATLTPLAMLFSFMAGLAGMFIAPLASWIAWPAKLVTTYMLDVAHLLSLIPHGFNEGITITLQQMITIYILILIFTGALWFRAKARNEIRDLESEMEMNSTLLNTKPNVETP